MKRILIVEDDKLTLESLNRIFSKEMEVSMCPSVEVFYNKYYGDMFDLIIMDISLRGRMDGLVLTKELRKTKEYSGIPILCLSAHARNSDRESAMAAGVNMFLTKPVSNKILVESVKSLLKK